MGSLQQGGRAAPWLAPRALTPNTSPRTTCCLWAWATVRRRPRGIRAHSRGQGGPGRNDGSHPRTWAREGGWGPLLPKWEGTELRAPGWGLPRGTWTAGCLGLPDPDLEVCGLSSCPGAERADGHQAYTRPPAPGSAAMGSNHFLPATRFRPQCLWFIPKSPRFEPSAGWGRSGCAAPVPAGHHRPSSRCWSPEGGGRPRGATRGPGPCPAAPAVAGHRPTASVAGGRRKWG